MSLRGTLFRLRQNSLGEHSTNWPENTYSRPTNAQVFARFRPRNLLRHRDPHFWEHERLSHHDRNGFFYEEGSYEDNVLLRLPQNYGAHFYTDPFYQSTRAGDLHVSVDRYGPDDYAHHILLQRERGIFRRLRERLRRRTLLREAGLERDDDQHHDQQLRLRLRGGAGSGDDFDFRDDETTLHSPPSPYPSTDNIEHRTEFSNSLNEDITIHLRQHEEIRVGHNQHVEAQGNPETHLGSCSADAEQGKARGERPGHSESHMPNVHGNRAGNMSPDLLTTDGFRQCEAPIIPDPVPPGFQPDYIQHYRIRGTGQILYGPNCQIIPYGRLDPNRPVELRVNERHINPLLLRRYGVSYQLFSSGLNNLVITDHVPHPLLQQLLDETQRYKFDSDFRMRVLRDIQSGLEVKVTVGGREENWGGWGAETPEYGAGEDQ